MSVAGVLHILSAPPELCPHIDWTLFGILHKPVSLSWTSQPACPGTVRSELAFEAVPGTAAAVTSALANWGQLRFEVTEDRSPGCDATRYSYTPALGIFTAVTAANGDILIPEGRLRQALSEASAPGASLAAELALLLGAAWDDELEPFRQAVAQLGTPPLTVVG